jgi:hypothetical protein
LFIVAFGYNSPLRLPDVTKVVAFPLFSMTTGRCSPSKDLTQQLVQLTSGGSNAYLNPLKDIMQFAAGKQQ